MAEQLREAMRGPMTEMVGLALQNSGPPPLDLREEILTYINWHYCSLCASPRLAIPPFLHINTATEECTPETRQHGAMMVADVLEELVASGLIDAQTIAQVVLRRPVTEEVQVAFDDEQVMVRIVKECVHCGRSIISSDGSWVDPNADGDDILWRETCDENDSTWAEHEPKEGDDG